VAFVFSLFAPALSHAFAPRQAPMASEVCTAMGMVMMPMADSPDHDADQNAAAGKGMAHCDLCCSHHAPVTLLSPPDLPLRLAATRDTYPALYYQSPSPQFAWTPAQSRAPPARFA